MASIKITKFGGLAPSVDARNLPPEGAQTAHNLNLRYGDFRPLKAPGASVAAVPALAKSIFRTPSGVWLSSTNDVNYVNGQINDAATERVYLTGRSAYPEAWQGGTYRRLGVPKPTTAPDITLVPVDQYSATDATADQKAATDLVLAQVTANESDILLGNAPPVGIGAVIPSPDARYNEVHLHLQFTSPLVGGTFVDSSPQKKTITKDASVTLEVDNLGPLGAAGTGYAKFTGGANPGIYFPSVDCERGQPWTVDVQLLSAVAMQSIQVWASRGLIRKVSMQTAAGAYKTLWCEKGYTLNEFWQQITCRRASGADVLAAGVKAQITLQNTGTCVQIFIDGVYAGRTPGSEGLRLSMIGAADDVGGQGFDVKMDEFRASLFARYDTADPPANFAPVVAPFGTAANPTGFWLLHGDAGCPLLPTSAAGDVAYLVPLTLVSGAYTTTAPGDAYLMQGILGGAQVTYGGNQYWAVPVSGYQAPSKSINEAALDAGLAAIVNPSAPPPLLLTAGEATALAASIAALYDGYQNPTLGFVTALNARQSDVRAGIVTGNPGGDAAGAAATLKNLIGLLEAQSDTLTGYFAGIATPVTSILITDYSTIFGAFSSLVVQQLFEDRAYIVTFVTDWGEESAPSPPSELLQLDQNDAILVVAPTPAAGRNIVGWRLYRSSTTNSGAAFQLVEDKTADNAVLTGAAFNYFSTSKLTYTDAKLQAELQEVCPSLTWEEPDARMIGLVGAPNGIMAGFFGKTLCMCVPYKPNAWPIEYQQSLEFDIVGLGVFGQTVVVVTKGNPYYASGADPASMSAQKLESPQAGMAKRTIVAVEGGVAYASPDGLCLASPTGVNLITVAAFSREDWQAAVTSAAFAAFHEGVYYLFTV